MVRAPLTKYPPPHPFEYNEQLQELRALAKMFGLNYIIGAHTTWPTPNTWKHSFFAGDLNNSKLAVLTWDTFEGLAAYVKALTSEKNLDR